jgi:hypothetical protein
MARRQESSPAQFLSLDFIVLTVVFFGDLGVLLYICTHGSGNFAWYFEPLGVSLAALMIAGYASSIKVSIRLRDICQDASLGAVNSSFSLENALGDVASKVLWGLITLLFAIGMLLLCVVHINAKVVH